MRVQFGLDKPIVVRYFVWVKEFVSGNFGYSILERRAVSDMIKQRLPNTLELAVVAWLLSHTWATLAGVVAALKQYSVVDYVLTIISFTLSGMPQFFTAIILIVIFAAELRWLPISGRVTPNVPFNWGDHIQHMILPVIVLSLPAASLLRQARSAMLEEMNKDYAVVARAKGLSERVVNYRHVLRNALLPLVTLAGLSLPSLIGGAVIVEKMFAWPGMGKMAVDSAVSKDYPSLMAIVTISGVVLLGANLLTDIAYAWVDPRIRVYE
jgi:peptide/nickel transport system permease protein